MMVVSKVQLSATEVKTLAVSSNAAMPEPLSSTPAAASHKSVQMRTVETSQNIFRNNNNIIIINTKTSTATTYSEPRAQKLNKTDG